MRAFSTVFIAAVLALSSANAAAVEKRAVSTAAALCISDLNSVGEQLTLLKTDVDELTLGPNFFGHLRITDNKITELGSRIVKATTDCNTISGPTNVEDITAILANFGTLVPKFTGALNSFKSKKEMFDYNQFITNTVGNYIKVLETKTTALSTVLITKFPTIPQNYLKTLQGYVTQINAEFTAVKKEYASKPKQDDLFSPF